MWPLRRRDLTDLLRQNIDSANARTSNAGNWLVGLDVACGVQDMEISLQSAGLDNGVEPDRSAA